MKTDRTLNATYPCSGERVTDIFELEMEWKTAVGLELVDFFYLR